MRVPVASDPHEHLVLAVPWILVIRIGVQWYLVLICNSLMNRMLNIFYMLTCYLHIFSWSYLFIFKLGIFLLLSFKCFLYIWRHYFIIK